MVRPALVRAMMWSTVKFWNGNWWPRPAHRPSCYPYSVRLCALYGGCLPTSGLLGMSVRWITFTACVVRLARWPMRFRRKRWTISSTALGLMSRPVYSPPSA